MFTALTMYIAVMLLASWIPAQWKRRLVGMGLFTDIAVHVILQSMFGGDAAGRAGLLLAGVMINGTMHLYRKMAGYEVPDKDWIINLPTQLLRRYAYQEPVDWDSGWVRYEGTLSKLAPTKQKTKRNSQAKAASSTTPRQTAKRAPRVRGAKR